MATCMNPKLAQAFQPGFAIQGVQANLVGADLEAAQIRAAIFQAGPSTNIFNKELA
jgi:hypothetical protein